MIHLKPAEKTARFNCCFKSTLMLAPGDEVTDNPDLVTCPCIIDYADFEKILTAPMNRYNGMAEKIKRLIWEMLSRRRYDNAFQIPAEKRRDFLEDFGKNLRKLEDEDDGRDILLSIRKEQIKQLKHLGRAYRDDAREARTILKLIAEANPIYPLEEMPTRCGTCVMPNLCMDCSRAESTAQHNALFRKIQAFIDKGEPI